jgi:hypothetical protein
MVGKKFIRTFDWKTQKEKPRRWARRRRENIETYLKEIGYEVVNWVQLAEDRV